MPYPLSLRLRKLWPLLLLFLTLPVMVTMLLYGLPMTHDGVTHLFRIARLDEYIRQGMIFPRWMPDMLLGYGYPTLNYYAASTYYLTEIYHFLGLSLYYGFIAAQWTLTLLAAFGIFLYARDMLDEDGLAAPLVVTIAYVYAPYLLTNIYVRGAIAELGAQALLPWILWSYRRLWRAPNPRSYVFVAALSLAALAWTHTISLLIVPLLLLCYMAVLAGTADARRQRLILSATAIGLAMLVSCFYWLPMIVERGNITDYGLTIATTMMLPKSFFRWDNLLNPGFQYWYPQDPPFRFGLVQLTGLLIGLPFLMRKGREWWFWLAVLAICGFLMSQVAAPIWFSNNILPIIQFPWRLLAIAQLPIALFIGLPFIFIRNAWLRGVAALAAVALLIWVHYPRMQWEYVLSPKSSQFDMSVNAYFESGRGHIIEGDFGTASIQEFRPKWTTQMLRVDPTTIDLPLAQPSGAEQAPSTLEVLRANGFGLELRTVSQTPFLLRLAAYYFPGWTITLDGEAPLTPKPTTNLGLLSAEIPPGEHVVTVVWTGTRTATVAAIISQIGLVLLGAYQLAQPSRQRWWGLLVVPLLAIGLVGSYLRAPLQPITQFPQATGIPGLVSLGYRGPELTTNGIAIHPYWYVTNNTPAPFQIRWRLRSEAGEIVQEMTSNPHFDSYPSTEWPGLTLMDDDHLIPLPANLPPGTYTVEMALLDPETGDETLATTMGDVTVDHATGQPTPSNPLQVTFGEDVILHSYDARMIEALASGQARTPGRADLPVVPTGNTMEYTLAWGLSQQTNEPYVGFIHLTDELGNAIAHDDHSPGPLFQPVAIWTPYGMYTDRYLLHIPPDAASGLYWPHVGMYNWKDLHRFDVRTPDSDTVGDHYRLPPVKVLNREIRPEGIAAGVHLGEMADLVRYQIDGGTAGTGPATLSIQPGDTITITAYYQAKTSTPESLTRFVQIRDAANQIIAQADAEPQNGVNPTWAWLEGEIVRDVITVQIPEAASAGTYTGTLGFYDAAADYARLPITDAQGALLPGSEFPFAEIVVTE